MIRYKNFLETGKVPKTEHVVSSRKHLLFRSYQKDTLQTYITKRIKVKDEMMMNYYKFHIYNHVLPYLRMTTHGNNYNPMRLSSEVGEFVIQGKIKKDIASQYNTVDSGDEQAENEIQTDSLTLFLSKKLISGMTLKEMIMRKDQRLDEQFCLDLVQSLVDFMLGANGIPQLLLTTENIIVSDCGQIHINYFSMVGIDFLKLDKYISKGQFQEILPYLTSSFLEQNKSKIPFQVQLKFLMINFYSAFMKRDIIFDSSTIDLNLEIKKTDEKVSKAINKVQKQLYPKLYEQCKEQIQKFDKKNSVRYQALLASTMNQEGLASSWQQAIQYLSRFKAKQKQGERLEQISLQADFKYFEQLDGNEHTLACNFFQAIDIYINVLRHTVKEQEKTTNQLEVWKKLLKRVTELQNQRQISIENQTYSQCLFIPIKFGMKFSQILKFKNYIHMLNNSTESTLAIFDSVKKMIHFCLEIKENMILLEPHIDRQTLLGILEKNRVKNELYENSLYKSISAQMESIQRQTGKQQVVQFQRIKQSLWQKFFWTINQIIHLIKKYYLSTTQYSIDKFKVNKQEFTSIFKMIDFSIPPIQQHK